MDKCTDLCACICRAPSHLRIPYLIKICSKVASLNLNQYSTMHVVKLFVQMSVWLVILNKNEYRPKPIFDEFTRFFPLATPRKKHWTRPWWSQLNYGLMLRVLLHTSNFRDLYLLPNICKSVFVGGGDLDKSDILT